MGPKTKSAHLLRWHYGDRVTMGQFSNSFPKHFSYLCEYAFRFDLSCSFCEYPFIFHCLHCSPSCFDPDSLLLAHLWLGLSWIYCISAHKSFSSPKTSSRKPYTSSKQQERQKHSVETTINFSRARRPSGLPGSVMWRCRVACVTRRWTVVSSRCRGSPFQMWGQEVPVSAGSTDSRGCTRSWWASR